LAWLACVVTRATATVAALFESGSPVFGAVAPGRLDVMGGIADYSGSLVLQQTLGVRTAAFAQVRPHRLRFDFDIHRRHRLRHTPRRQRFRRSAP